MNVKNSSKNNQSTQKGRSFCIFGHTKYSLSVYLKEVVYGGTDGIITTFAVVAGFSGAAISGDVATTLTFTVVLLFGLANLLADGVSMGLSNFLSVRTQKDQYLVTRGVVKRMIRSDTDREFKETVELLKDKGFAEQEAVSLAEIYKNNEDYWIDFLVTHKKDMSDPRGENATLTGLTTFTAFLVFGSVPLLPFILLDSGDAKLSFMLSIAGTFSALFLLGYLKWYILGGRFLRSVFEVVLIGGAAAVVAFWVGTFFSDL